MRHIAWIATPIVILFSNLATPLAAQELAPSGSSRSPEAKGQSQAIAEELAEIRRDISGDSRHTNSALALPALPGGANDDDRENLSRFNAAVARLAEIRPVNTDNTKTSNTARLDGNRGATDPRGAKTCFFSDLVRWPSKAVAARSSHDRDAMGTPAEDRPQPPSYHRTNWSTQPERTTIPSPGPVIALRDAAWRLDQAAESLERACLYQQADALRVQAAELRQEARDLLAHNRQRSTDLVDTRASCR